MAYNDRAEQLERAYRVLSPQDAADLERTYNLLDACQELIEAEARRGELVAEVDAARAAGYHPPSNRSRATGRPVAKLKPRLKFTEAQLRIAIADHERRRKSA